ncbi:MAG TPA: carboxypeptidase-like regulatory domain-containing protein [Gemmatimonadales bacterium]|nr:carboxypeptidase-like regulatory domain-containing protein [Gemmatimonadales bacterium]
MIGLALVATITLTQAPLDSLHGTVRAVGTGEVIPGVRVGLVGRADFVLTDVRGQYAVHHPPGSRLQLRFERLGFDALVVDVTAVGASVDVDLAEHNPLVGESDVLAGLAAAPFVTNRGDLATSLRVHGASDHENLLLIDGLPWRGPPPPGGVAELLPSTAIATADVYTSVLPARYGDALSRVMVLQPQMGQRASADGSIDPNAIEQAVGAFLPCPRKGKSAVRG